VDGPLGIPVDPPAYGPPPQGSDTDAVVIETEDGTRVIVVR
jgi:hypothetical protein